MTRRIVAWVRLAVDTARLVVRGIRVRRRARDAWRAWTDEDRDAERISWR